MLFQCLGFIGRPPTGLQMCCDLIPDRQTGRHTDRQTKRHCRDMNIGVYHFVSYKRNGRIHWKSDAPALVQCYINISDVDTILPVWCIYRGILLLLKG